MKHSLTVGAIAAISLAGCRAWIDPAQSITVYVRAPSATVRQADDTVELPAPATFEIRQSELRTSPGRRTFIVTSPGRVDTVRPDATHDMRMLARQSIFDAAFGADTSYTYDSRIYVVPGDTSAGYPGRRYGTQAAGNVRLRGSVAAPFLPLRGAILALDIAVGSDQRTWSFAVGPHIARTTFRELDTETGATIHERSSTSLGLTLGAVSNGYFGLGFEFSPSFLHYTDEWRQEINVLFSLGVHLATPAPGLF
jgi:hypothetical protein